MRHLANLFPREKDRDLVLPVLDANALAHQAGAHQDAIASPTNVAAMGHFPHFAAAGITHLRQARRSRSRTGRKATQRRSATQSLMPPHPGVNLPPPALHPPSKKLAGPAGPPGADIPAPTPHAARPLFP